MVKSSKIEPLPKGGLESIENVFKEIEEDEAMQNFMVGSVLFMNNSPKAGLEAFEKAKLLAKNKNDKVLTNLLDAFIELGKAAVHAGNLNHTEAINHFSISKNNFKKLTSQTPEIFKKWVDVLLVTTEITLISTIASQSEIQRDYNTAASKYDEAAEMVKKSLNIFQDLGFPSLVSNFTGMGLMLSGRGKLARSEFLSNSGLNEEAISLCEQAKIDLNSAADEFLEGGVYNSDDSRQRSLQYAHIIIPSIISSYKNKMLLQDEIKKLKKENEEYKQIIANALNQTMKPTINMKQESTQVQENIIVQNFSSDLRGLLKDLLNGFNNIQSPEMDKIVSEIQSTLGESTNSNFLLRAKTLGGVLDNFIKHGKKVAPFIPLITKILALLHLLP